MIDWKVEGVEFSACNCAYGCPCQFEALPTHGDCRGFEVVRIDDGRIGEVDVSGVNVAVLYAWPGPVFEGHGELQVVIDERAGPEQRAVLETVLHGRETEEGATHWWVFAAMSDTLHETLFRPIEFEVDIEARRARVRIPGVLEASGAPIRPPHSDPGTEHRARIEIPHGIEFEVAEMGSSRMRTEETPAIQLDGRDCYAQFNRLHHSRTGVVAA